MNRVVDGVCSDAFRVSRDPETASATPYSAGAFSSCSSCLFSRPLADFLFNKTNENEQARDCDALVTPCGSLRVVFGS
jgi:hypothetical protein